MMNSAVHKFWLALLLLIWAFFAIDDSVAQTISSPKLPAALICGPFSGNPPRTPAFADKFTLDFSNNVLTGRRPTIRQKGEEAYRGSIEPSGKIKISGTGHFDDRSSEWTSEYLGQLQDKRPTILQGAMQVKNIRTGTRTIKCSIIFLSPPDDLMKALSPDNGKAQMQ